MRLIDADKVLEFMQNKLDMQELYLPVHLKELVTDEMPTVGGWIPCSERLPEKVGGYLVSIDRYYLGKYVGSSTTMDRWNGHGWDMYGTTILHTAWQPLPAPYKEVEQ